MPEGEIQNTVEYFPKRNGGQQSSLEQNKLIKNLGETKDSKESVLYDRLQECFSNGAYAACQEEPPTSYTWQFVEGRGYHHSLPAEHFLSPQRLGVFFRSGSPG